MKKLLVIISSAVFLFQCTPRTEEDIPTDGINLETAKENGNVNVANYWLNTHFLRCLKEENISTCRCEVDNYMVYIKDSTVELFGSYINHIHCPDVFPKDDMLFVIINDDTLKLYYGQSMDTLYLGEESFITNPEWKKSNCYFKIYGQNFYEKYESFVAAFYDKDSISIGYDNVLDVYLVRYGESIDETDVLEFVGDSVYISDYLNADEGRAIEKSFLELSLKVKFPR